MMAGICLPDSWWVRIEDGQALVGGKKVLS